MRVEEDLLLPTTPGISMEKEGSDCGRNAHTNGKGTEGGKDSSQGDDMPPAGPDSPSPLLLLSMPPLLQFNFSFPLQDHEKAILAPRSPLTLSVVEAPQMWRA